MNIMFQKKSNRLPRARGWINENVPACLQRYSVPDIKVIEMIYFEYKQQDATNNFLGG
jgi:hypothetical protein